MKISTQQHPTHYHLSPSSLLSLVDPLPTGELNSLCVDPSRVLDLNWGRVGLEDHRPRDHPLGEPHLYSGNRLESCSPSDNCGADEHWCVRVIELAIYTDADPAIVVDHLELPTGIDRAICPAHDAASVESAGLAELDLLLVGQRLDKCSTFEFLYAKDLIFVLPLKLIVGKVVESTRPDGGVLTVDLPGNAEGMLVVFEVGEIIGVNVDI